MAKQATNNKHIHKFIRIGPIWKCGSPDCTFFVYQKQEYVILGRKSICWGCGNPFVMQEANMKDEIPMCINCEAPGITEHILDNDIEDFITSRKKASNE